MAVDLFAQTTSTILALGVGGAGGRVATAGAANADVAGGAPCAAWCAAHLDRAELMATGLDRRILLEAADGPFVFQNAEHSVAAHAAKLAALMAGRGAVILLGCLEEHSARVLLPALGGYFRAENLFVCAIAAEPAHASPDSSSTLDRIAANCDLFLTLSPEILRAGVDPSCPLSELAAARERKLLAAAEALAGALACGVPGLQFSAPQLRAALRGGDIRTTLANASGPEALLRAAQAALEQLESAPLAGAHFPILASALMTSREPSALEADALRHLLRERNATAQSTHGAPTLLGVSTQAHLEDEAVCVLMAGHASRGKAIPLSSMRAL